MVSIPPGEVPLNCSRLRLRDAQTFAVLDLIFNNLTGSLRDVSLELTISGKLLHGKVNESYSL